LFAYEARCTHPDHYAVFLSAIDPDKWTDDALVEELIGKLMATVENNPEWIEFPKVLPHWIRILSQLKPDDLIRYCLNWISDIPTDHAFVAANGGYIIDAYGQVSDNLKIEFLKMVVFDDWHWFIQKKPELVDLLTNQGAEIFTQVCLFATAESLHELGIAVKRLTREKKAAHTKLRLVATNMAYAFLEKGEALTAFAAFLSSTSHTYTAEDYLAFVYELQKLEVDTNKMIGEFTFINPLKPSMVYSLLKLKGISQTNLAVQLLPLVDDPAKLKLILNTLTTAVTAKDCDQLILREHVETIKWIDYEAWPNFDYLLIHGSDFWVAHLSVARLTENPDDEVAQAAYKRILSTQDKKNQEFLLNL
jgi:hypothetical protein